MFRFRRSWGTRCGSFPRIRGDVPYAAPELVTEPPFSPHTRGCSVLLAPVWCTATVFPAYAGMFRRTPAKRNNKDCFPRIRGDVPYCKKLGLVFEKFSPHTRGCSGNARFAAPVPQVFPAYAGMFLILIFCGYCPRSFPRIRGDVPALGSVNESGSEFSPHTRGCSA